MSTTEPEQSVRIEPTVADIIENLPEAGQIYVTHALTKWKAKVEAMVAAQQMAQRDQHIATLRAALLSAGIDPMTLQAQGAPEVGIVIPDMETGTPVPETLEAGVPTLDLAEHADT